MKAVQPPDAPFARRTFRAEEVKDSSFNTTNLIRHRANINRATVSTSQRHRKQQSIKDILKKEKLPGTSERAKAITKNLHLILPKYESESGDEEKDSPLF